MCYFFFSSRRRHTRFKCDWSSDVCSSDLDAEAEEVPEVVVRDRQHLAEDGFVIVVVAIDSAGTLVRDPEIITRGLVHVDANQEMLDEVRGMLVGMLAETPRAELRDSEVLQ